MIIGNILSKRAVSVLLTGMALFLIGCQPKGKRPPEKEAEIPFDSFAIAEKHREKGELAQALAQYETFVKQAKRDERAPLALKRIAEIQLKRKNPEAALAALEEISTSYPDDTWIPEIRYQISVILNRLGHYDDSAGAAIRWLDQYQGHFLRKAVLTLLGDDFCAMGNAEAAFSCWIEAKRSGKGDPAKDEALDQKLMALIDTSSPLLLSRLLEKDGEASYPPEIYYRIASVFLWQKEPEQAERAARILIESTRDLDWVKKGEDVLAQASRELAICENCIGCLLPLSGPFAAYGREVLNGVILGMLTDPVKGAQMEVIIRDSAGEPEKALSELENLVKERRIAGIIGPLSSKTAAPVSLKAQELGVPVIALTQKRDVVESGDMVFRNFLTPAQEIDLLLEVAMEQLGLKRFGILYPDNTYGRFCMNRFWDKLDELGGSVTAVESYSPDVTDFEDPIKKMVGLYYPRGANWRSVYGQASATGTEENSEPLEEDDPIVDFDAVFIPDTYHRVAMIAPQLAFHDVMGIRLMGTRLWHSPKLVELAGNYLQGSLFSSGFVAELEDPKVMAFVAGYEENFGAAPGILAANGYDTICLLKKVFSIYGPKTRENLKEALLDIPAYDGVTGTFRFNAQGEALKSPLLLTISGPRMMPVY